VNFANSSEDRVDLVLGLGTLHCLTQQQPAE
jgi:agmatine/peptidylarginine deiminase